MHIPMPRGRISEMGSLTRSVPPLYASPFIGLIICILCLISAHAAPEGPMGLQRSITMVIVSSSFLCIAFGMLVRMRKVPLGHGAEVYIFIGNPGTGKSAVLNALVQEPLFKAGISTDSGMTHVSQEETRNGKIYVDTPGLVDRVNAERATKEIAKSLKRDGSCHVFFFAHLDAGRIRLQDTVMINAVLRSAPITEYSVIFNSVGRNVMKHLDNPISKGRIIDMLMAGLPIRTKRFYFIARDDDMADADDIVWDETKLPPGLRDFISTAPGMRIKEEEVVTIRVADIWASLSPMYC